MMKTQSCDDYCSAIDLAQEAAAADFDWWNSQIDNLLICMMPLWEKCGIHSPGIWIDDGRFAPTSRLVGCYGY